MIFDEFIEFLKERFDREFFVFHKGKREFFVVKGKQVKQIGVPEILEDELDAEFLGTKKFFRKGKEVYFLFVPLKLSKFESILIFMLKSGMEDVSQFLKFSLEELVKLQSSSLQNERELEFLRDELHECESTVSRFDQQIKELESLIDDYRLQIEGLEKSVEILRNSRAKMLKLIDGMSEPLFSLNRDYELNNVNRALGEFVGVNELPKFIGNACYKTIFNFDEPCKWCKLNEVMESKVSVTQNISLEKDGETIWLEQRMYPIIDENGSVVEVGEFLRDITEQYRLIEDLKQSREKVKKVSKDRIKALNEINQVKQEYNNLLEEYNSLVEKNKKLTSVIEKLVTETHAGQVLELRKENKALKVKLAKFLDVIEKLKVDIERLKKSEIENLKKSVYSIDRLYNIVTKRADLKREELENILNLINNQLKDIKKKLEVKEELDGGESSD